MRVLKVKWFTRYAKQEDIDDVALADTVKKAEAGLIDADLGGNLIKLRIAKKGRGRSAGYRTLIAYRENKIAVFLYGFAKNELDNISDKQAKSLKKMSSKFVKMTDNEINQLLVQGTLDEVKYERK